MHSSVEVWTRQNKSPDADEDPNRDVLRQARALLEMSKARREKALAEKEELKLAQLKRNLAEIDVMKEEIEQMLVLFRDNLVRLPEELAAELPTEMKALQIAHGRRRVNALLTQLANQSGRLFDRGTA